MAPTQRSVAAEPACRVVIKRLVGMLIDVVRTTVTNRGRSCPRHSCCGMQVAEKSTVAFHREQLVYRDRRKEDVIAAYLVLHGVMPCKVSFYLRTSTVVQGTTTGSSLAWSLCTLTAAPTW